MNREFEFKGQTYRFRFSWRAIKAFQNMTGKAIEKLSNPGLDEIELVVWCGLTGGNDHELKRDDVVELLDENPAYLQRAMSIFQHDIQASFGAPDDEKKS